MGRKQQDANATRRLHATEYERVVAPHGAETVSHRTGTSSHSKPNHEAGATSPSLRSSGGSILQLSRDQIFPHDDAPERDQVYVRRLLEDIARRQEGDKNVDALVRKWMEELGPEVKRQVDLLDLTAAPNTWAGVKLPPLVKARIEIILRADTDRDVSPLVEDLENVELSDSDQDLKEDRDPRNDDAWTTRQNLEDLYHQSGFMHKIRSFLAILHQSKFMPVLEIFEALLAVYVCIVFCWSTYQYPRPLWVAIAYLICAGFFIFGFMVHWALSQRMVLFLVSPMAILDYITIFPLFLPIFGRRPYLEWLVGLVALRIYRAVPALRLLHFSTFRIKVLKVLVQAFSVIFFAASIFVYAEDLAFHTSIYFIVISFTTVGYGDISPVTFWGRLAIVLLIIFIFIAVPFHTDLIADIIKSYDNYSGSYVPGVISRPPFVVVVGDIDEITITNFLTEFYHRNHTSYFEFHRVVVLHPEDPTDTIRALVRTHYRGRFFYFKGSPLLEIDLERVKLTQAHAIFILSTNDGTKRRTHKDKNSIIEALSIRKHSHGSPTILQIQRNVSYPIALLTRPTLLVCIEQLKMGILVRSFEISGLSTLIGNLLRATNLPRLRPLRPWMREYAKGESVEIYKLNLPRVYINYRYVVLLRYFYEEYHALLFAIKENREDQKCVINPRNNYAFQGGEILFIICHDYQTIRLLENVFSQISCTSYPKIRQLDDFEEQYAGNEKILESSDLPEQPFPEAWNPLCFQDQSPAGCYEDAIRDDVRDLSDHIIITGSSAFLSYDLPTLRGMTGNKPTVVLFNQELPTEEQWQRASRRATVFIVKGNSLIRDDLLRAGTETARLFVVTADSDTTVDIRDTDSDSVITFLAVKAIRRTLDVRLELTSINTLKLFKQDHLPGQKFNTMLPEYASGNFFLTNIADRVSIQCFYNPDTLDIINQIIGSAPSESALSLREISDQYWNVEFFNLFHDMLLKNALIIGLYRYNEEDNHHYVYTKPTLNTMIRETDKMYIFIRNEKQTDLTS